MPSTSKSFRRKKKKSKFVRKQKPPWLELPSDLMLNILQRLSVADRLQNAQKVCTAWREICKDPFIKESLRMYPPLPLLVPHKSMQDVTVMGYEVPSNTQVVINAWAIGRDPSKWEEPNEFRPERFLNKSIDYKGINFEWLPFGAGRRGCPGIQFGVAIMELALANIVYKFDLALPDGVKCEDFDMSEICGITLHRKTSLKLKVSSRF